MPSTEHYPHALHTCRRLMARSNTTASDSPLLFRACMCANHWSAACAGIVTQEEAAVASGLAAAGHTHTVGHTTLRQGPVIPLCTVLGIVCVGIVVTLYAYKNRRKLEQQAEIRDRRRTLRLHVLHCEVTPVPGSSSAASTSSETPSTDPPPPYAVAEAPPPYQAVCSSGAGVPKPVLSAVTAATPALTPISEGSSSEDVSSDDAKSETTVHRRPPEE